MSSSSAAQNGWSNLYHYDPIIGIAVAAAVLYTIAFVIVTWQTRKFRLKYMHVVSVTAFCKLLFLNEPRIPIHVTNHLFTSTQARH
jgi:hypothetical protein